MNGLFLRALSKDGPVDSCANYFECFTLSPFLIATLTMHLKLIASIHLSECVWVEHVVRDLRQLKLKCEQPLSVWLNDWTEDRSQIWPKGHKVKRVRTIVSQFREHRANPGENEIRISVEKWRVRYRTSITVRKLIFHFLLKAIIAIIIIGYCNSRL